MASPYEQQIIKEELLDPLTKQREMEAVSALERAAMRCHRTIQRGLMPFTHICSTDL